MIGEKERNHLLKHYRAGQLRERGRSLVKEQQIELIKEKSTENKGQRQFV